MITKSRRSKKSCLELICCVSHCALFTWFCDRIWEESFASRRWVHHLRFAWKYFRMIKKKLSVRIPLRLSSICRWPRHRPSSVLWISFETWKHYVMLTRNLSAYQCVELERRSETSADFIRVLDFDEGIWIFRFIEQLLGVLKNATPIDHFLLAGAAFRV